METLSFHLHRVSSGKHRPFPLKELYLHFPTDIVYPIRSIIFSAHFTPFFSVSRKRAIPCGHDAS